MRDLIRRTVNATRYFVEAFRAIGRMEDPEVTYAEITELRRKYGLKEWDGRG